MTGMNDVLNSQDYSEAALENRIPRGAWILMITIAMLVVTGIQVLLGFTVYLILLIVAENNMALIVSGILHVFTGSLTLASTVVMALELRRCESHTPVIDRYTEREQGLSNTIGGG